MLLTLTATADYDLPQETFLLLMVEPLLHGAHHHVMEENLRTTPVRFAELSRDGFGNVVRRFVAPPGFFTFDFQAIVDAEPNALIPDETTEHPPRRLPLDVLAYTLPSRYCPSDRLGRLAWGEFGMLPPGGGRVRAIADWVRSHIEYVPSGPETRISAFHTTLASADETALRRVGDSRDMAHLCIAVYRALGIPARFVSGYGLGVEGPDFHAWVQVYLGSDWHNVDATLARARPALIPIAFGRDAADVSPLTFWGVGRLRELSALVRRVETIE